MVRDLVRRARTWGRSLTRRQVLLIGTVVLTILAGRFVFTLDARLAARAPSHLLLDRTGRYLAEVPGSQEAWGYWVLPDVLPEKIVLTTLETEDRHFYEHGGVRASSIARAMWQNVKALRIVSGASTIPMQLARMQHPKSRTLWGKAREAVEAMLLVRNHGHDKVLRQYLTLAPYGNRCHGVVRAARLYFDKPAEDLSWLQAAYLAALPQQPGRMSPWTSKGHAIALKRARRILTQLNTRGVISNDDLRIALNSDLHVVPRPRAHPEAMHAILALSRDVKASAEVIHHATLDLDVQRIAQRTLQDNLRRWRPAGAGNTAGVVVDLPSGEILAWVGSADYFDVEARGAIDYLSAKRSPGSSLKPFIYAMALERGTHTAATELADIPIEFEAGRGGIWVPENISHNFLGPMLLREALANSRNIPALRVLSDVGVDRAVAMFDRAGVRGVRYDPDAYGLSLAMGGLHVTPLELASLYTALANRGETIPLRRWLEPSARPAGVRLFSQEAAMLTAHILADSKARRPGFPAGSALDFDYAVGIKTGTSQGYRDAWVSAFSDRLLVVAWVGNHDWRRMHLASGATAVAPAAHHILDEVMPRRARHQPIALELPLPAGLVERKVCALSGRLPEPGCTHLKTEYFIPGTEPHESCSFHVKVPIDVRNGLRAGPSCAARFVVKRPMLDMPEAYAPWARRQQLSIAPRAESPLCATSFAAERRIAIREPRSMSRFLFDPDTPHELSTVRLSASVAPLTEEVVWLLDNEPIARVGYPHEVRWALTPGRHTIRARLAHSGDLSAPVTVVVDD
jgi:penicillin-binding protein 1C